MVAGFGHANTCKVLLYTDPDAKSFTALAVAAINGHADIYKVLILQRKAVLVLIKATVLAVGVRWFGARGYL